jgi:class 3 adenylate cyclase
MAAVLDLPETRYTKLGDDRIAYQALGEGPVDLLTVPASGDCMDLRWDFPPYERFLRNLASFSRLVMFDRRGVGASDPTSGDALPSWERWADEARAVLDAVGSNQAVIMGVADSTPTALLFAAVHTDRTRALILFNGTARFLTDTDYPGGLPASDLEGAIQILEEIWGTKAMADFASADMAATDPDFARWYARTTRLAISPKEAGAYLRWVQLTDVRDVLPSVHVPTLVMHRAGFSWITPDQGKYIADRVSGARFALVPGSDGAMFHEPTTETLRLLEEFITHLGGAMDSDRALAAILFTDIVGSTEMAAALGDRQWRNLLESHDAVARTLIDKHGGRLIKMTGDGLLATFDGPGRAIRCGFALRDSLEPLGIVIRAGLHTGEVELRGDDIGGIGVHIAARVLDQAKAGELLASSAVPLLVAGSGIAFDDRGEHDLKGVGALRLYAVAG